MTGHSILYLGRGDFAADYLSELETLPCCTLLTRSVELELPVDTPSIVDIVLLEAGPAIALSGRTLTTLMHALGDYPVIALTRKALEHRGIAAVRAGAQGYICVDDITVEGQEAVFDHAVKRNRLQQRLSETDVTVLSILTSINDGVVVVDQQGHILEINPAGRTILGLGPRMQPDPTWEQTFCCIDEHGSNYRNAADLPLFRARSGEKFSGQMAIYRSPQQPDTVLNINGHGLFDGNRELIGGVITFRDVTDITRKTIELQKRAQYDELTGLPNRS
ncbi:MAG: PAS domain-containing protein, partial [Proteobacteria bacterium]|nr:PAS domain-containing protein [Pseudomonadota bacterium]